MIDPSLILADQDAARIIKFLAGIAVVVIILVSKIFEAARKRKTEDAALRKATERRTGVSPQQERTRERSRGPMRRPQPYTHSPVRPSAATPSSRMQTTAFEPMTPPPLPQIPQRRAPVSPRPIAEEHTRTVRDHEDLDKVDEEVEQMRQGIEQKLTTRHQRMETAAPSEADTAAIDARISHFQRMEVQQDQVARVQVDLGNPRALRAAIIYHEILSPPKALRQGPEMWDR
jgi:hypothetical protein